MGPGHFVISDATATWTIAIDSPRVRTLDVITPTTPMLHPAEPVTLGMTPAIGTFSDAVAVAGDRYIVESIDVTAGATQLDLKMPAIATPEAVWVSATVNSTFTMCDGPLDCSAQQSTFIALFSNDKPEVATSRPGGFEP
jgi:hypothetical protein